MTTLSNKLGKMNKVKERDNYVVIAPNVNTPIIQTNLWKILTRKRSNQDNLFGSFPDAEKGHIKSKVILF